MLILGFVAAYLIVGAVLLALFDLKTGRIRDKLGAAAENTQKVMSTGGVWLRRGKARIVILLVTWLFWPVVFYGALESALKNTSKEGK